MAMVRSPTTSCWCLSTDTRYSTIDKLKRIASWSLKISAWSKATKFMHWNLWRITFTCSWNSTQARLCQKSFSTWKEAVLIGCSSFILNWKSAIGAVAYGQAANSFDPSEMWLLTRSLTILGSLRESRKQSLNCANLRGLGNEDLTISEIRKTEACSVRPEAYPTL